MYPSNFSNITKEAYQIATLNIIKAGAHCAYLQVTDLDTSFKSNRDFYWYLYSNANDWTLYGTTSNVTPSNSSQSYLMKWRNAYVGIITVKVKICTAGTTDVLAELTAKITTTNTVPTISVSASKATSSSITFTLTFSNVSASTLNIYWGYSGGSWKSEKNIPYQSSITFMDTNLSADTQYFYEVQVYKDKNEATDIIDTFYLYASTKPESEFEPFDWDYAGLDSSKKPISGSEKIAGYGVYVAASEWNRLVDCVNKFKETNIDHVNSGDTITATTVNEVARALGEGAVSRGDKITASFFNKLRSDYNDAIS